MCEDKLSIQVGCFNGCPRDVEGHGKHVPALHPRAGEELCEVRAGAQFTSHDAPCIVRRRGLGHHTEEPVWAGVEPTWTTVVKPWLRNMSASWVSSVAADFHSAMLHFGSVKWTWAFQKPAVTMQRLHGSCSVPAGISTFGPTAAIRPSRIRTVPSSMGGSEGET